MNSKLYVPKKLNVGYQERSDTYTGKLAYVVYTDDKGVLRKETSWKNWCKKFIGEFENKPTSGFVLNKGVGGARYSYGWNARNEYIRIYDPRGWEFEISVANLLFILQECTSTKGKGLEGEFVYSWYGKDLVLMPTSCEEYKACVEFTADQSKKVTKSDVSVGDWVRFKDGSERVYLGRIECRESMYSKHIKQHVYFHPENNTYRYEKGFTKLAEVLTKEDSFAEYLENYLKSYHCNKVVGIEWEDSGDTLTCGNWHYCLKDEEVYHVYIVHKPSHRNYYFRNYIEFEDNGKVTDLEDYMSHKNMYNHYSYLFTENAVNYKAVVPVLILENGEKFYPNN